MYRLTKVENCSKVERFKVDKQGVDLPLLHQNSAIDDEGNISGLFNSGNLLKYWTLCGKIICILGGSKNE